MTGAAPSLGVVLATGASSRPRLAVIGSLLGGFEEAGVAAVVFKGEHRLARALSGEGDLDLLVVPSELAPAEAVLRANGFVTLAAARWRRQPGVGDWFGVDPVTAALVHVQLASPLLLGPLPGSAVPGATGLVERAEGSMPRVASAADAAVIRLCDASLKGRFEGGRRQRELLADARTLVGQVSDEWLLEVAGELFDQRVAQAVSAVAKGGNARTLRRALQRHRVGRPRWSRPVDLLTSAVARLNRSTLRRSVLHRRPAGHPAPVVAVIGSDGSGKSTVSRRLVELLDPKIDARFTYFGTGDGPSSLLRRPLVALKRVWESRSGPPVAVEAQRDTARSARSVAAAPRTAPTAARILWAVVTTFERRAKLRRARRAARRGFVVVTDRFPQAEHAGIHDGPRLAALADLGPLGRAVSRWEDRQYAAMAAKGPDMVLHLDVSLDVATRRRPEETRDELARRIAVARDLTFDPADKVRLDAHAPLDEVTAEALRLVLARVGP